MQTESNLVKCRYETNPKTFSLSQNRSTMVVGEGGCVAMVFPRSTFIPFLDANPGVLLSLLGTQIVM